MEGREDTRWWSVGDFCVAKVRRWMYSYQYKGSRTYVWVLFALQQEWCLEESRGSGERRRRGGSSGTRALKYWGPSQPGLHDDGLGKDGKAKWPTSFQVHILLMTMRTCWSTSVSRSAVRKFSMRWEPIRMARCSFRGLSRLLHLSALFQMTCPIFAFSSSQYALKFAQWFNCLQSRILKSAAVFLSATSPCWMQSRHL